MSPENKPSQNSFEQTTEVLTQEKKLLDSLERINAVSNDALSEVKKAIYNYHALSASEVDRYHELIDNISSTFKKILQTPNNGKESTHSDLYATINDYLLDIFYVVDEQESDTYIEKEEKEKKRQMVDKIREKVKQIISVTQLG